MTEQANDFSADAFHCGLMITLSWDLWPELQQDAWMGVRCGVLHSSSTHCTRWPHRYTAPPPHSPQVGSWGSCSQPLLRRSGRNGVSEQQQLALCLEIPDGRSHFGAPRGMCQSRCPWLAGRPSTTRNLQSVKCKMSADKIVASFFFSSQVWWIQYRDRLGYSVSTVA